MEIVITPPKIFLAVVGGVLLVVVLSMLLKGGSAGRKISAFLITVAVLGVVTFIFYRPTTVSIDEVGISVKRFREQSIPWDRIDTAVWIPALSISEYRPGSRIVGVSLGVYKVGRFRLSNGDKARVIMEQDRDALLLLTRDDQFLFALKGNDELLDAVTRYTNVE